MTRRFQFIEPLRLKHQIGVDPALRMLLMLAPRPPAPTDQDALALRRLVLELGSSPSL